MPLKKQSIRGRTKRAVRSNSKRSAPSSSETNTDVAGNTNSTPDPAASASSNPEPATAPPPVRSIELNESVFERSEPRNCSIDRDKVLIANRNRNQDDDETLIRNSELVVERDEGNMDVNVSGGGGDVDGEREEGLKKKKTKVVKVVKKVVRVVKKRVPVRKGGPLIASAVENSGGAVLLPVQEQEIDKSDDNVVEEGGKFESLVSSSVRVEDYGAGQPLVAGEVGGSGRLGSVSMEEQEMDDCGDKVVVGSKEFESIASSPIMVGVVEDAEHSDRLASVCMEVENLETLRAAEAVEKEGVVEKCEPVVDMVLEDEASGEHENGSREGVTVGDDGDMGSRGLALSGELEAMERRKRRKTEIFIGGLHLSATEEDLKKAFVDVGEIVKVRLVLNFKTGKNRGFAFVRFASAADAKKALEKYPKVEVKK